MITKMKSIIAKIGNLDDEREEIENLDAFARTMVKMGYHLPVIGEQEQDRMFTALHQLSEGVRNNLRLSSLVALIMLARSGIVDARSLPVIVALLNDYDECVRGHAALGLVMLAQHDLISTEALSSLKNMLEDDDEECRAYAARAIGSMGKKVAIEKDVQVILKRMSEEDEDMPRKDAVNAMISIIWAEPDPEEAEGSGTLNAPDEVDGG